jgi:hypothetical protein
LPAHADSTRLAVSRDFEAKSINAYWLAFVTGSGTPLSSWVPRSSATNKPAI